MINLKNKALYFFIILLSFNFQSVFANEIKYVQLKDNKMVKFEKNIEYKVLYFFSYGCPYCYDFENYKEKFLSLKSDNVEFEHIPITSIPSWSEYTKAFLVSKSLNINIRKEIFQQVHIDGKKILTKDQLYLFFKDHFNIEYELIDKNYNSFYNNYRYKENEKIANLYEVTGTPSLVIINKNGNVFKTSPSISGNLINTIASTIYLTTKDKN